MINARRAYSIIFLSFLSIVIFSQTNLVPNPSFETYTACPTSLDQMNRCQDWSSYRESPDYFNKCSSTGLITPPSCFAGYQQPQSGNAHAGFLTYDITVGGSNYREIIGAKLISSLNIGTKYYFSFFVNFGGAQGFEFATNKIGLRFSTVSASTVNPFPISNFAHYYCPTKITDSLNWTKLKGSFIADSIYDFIAFGNFFNDSNTDTLSTGPYNQNSYYYIDNICLSTDSNFAYSTLVSSYDNHRSFSFFPNPASDILIFENFSKNEKYEIINVMGTIVKQGTCNGNKNTIDVSDLSDGLYFVMVRERKMKLLISH